MTNKKKGSPGGFATLGDILEDFDREEDKYIAHEFQKYGFDLANELGDLGNKSLYIKLAKEAPRGLLEEARNFVKDAKDVRSKPRLFMWKLKRLRDEKEENKKENEK